MRTINLIVIHCSATRCNQRFTVDMLRDCHNKRFHGKGIGYHYYIERDGQIHQTRAEEEIGMHALHYNAHSIGICYEGGLNEKGQSDDTRTEEQKHALIALLKELRKDYPDAEIVGHCELPKQRMPIELVRSWLSRDGSRPSQLPGVTKPCPCFSCQKYRDYFENDAKLA